jgi:hypothetical protein
MGGVLIKNVMQKTEKLSLKKTSRQPMGVDKVTSFEKFTNFTENFTLVGSSN